MYNQGLFNAWVPKAVQLLLIVVFTIFILPLGGVYTGNISFMAGGTGNLTEYFMWANYATTIGMGAAMPLAMRFKLRFKIRNKVTLILLLTALLSYISATTHQPMIFVMSSLFMGFMKMHAMVEFIIPLMMMLSPDGNRGRFYSLFYPFAIAMGQVGSYYATKVSFYTGWESFYILQAIICLGLALLAWITMHNQYFAKKMPLYYIDWLSILFFATTFMLGAYVLTFGKQQDWFNSSKIWLGCILSFISFGMLIGRQLQLKRPYVSFKIFKKDNVLHGLLMLMMLGVFMAISSVQTIFTSGVLGYDQLTNAKLNLMMIPGIVVGGLFGLNWFNKGRNVKMYVFVGFSSMIAYCVIMYLSMVPELNFERWYLTMFLKGFGMSALFISIWYYALDKLEMGDMLAATGLVLVWRSFLSVAVFSALFSWLQYQFQVESLGDMAVYLDATTLNQQNVLLNLKSFQINAILAANKKLLGYVILFGILVLTYVCLHHFGREKYTTLRFVRVLKGHALIAKRRRREALLIKNNERKIKDIAGTIS